ncbi:MAG: hypothetical protein K8I03_10475 [Ignavibacteria bacterium]|nr:hypothetical protein [Ignavibacteria bacterium]
MDKESFKKFTEDALKNILLFGEAFHRKPLPQKIVFQWGYGDKKERFRENLSQIIVDNPRVYIDEDHINPFLDLVVLDILPSNETLIGCYVSGHELRSFPERNWNGPPGPYIYLVLDKIRDKKISKDSIKKNLIEKGLYSEL